MHSIRIRRPSAALVISCVALLVALGGTSIAAVSALVPPNSVGTEQLRNNAVTGLKVKDGSLARKDFRTGQLPAGPPGAQGAKGDKGDVGPAGRDGVANAFIVTGAQNSNPTSTTTYTTVLSQQLAAGRYLIYATAHIGQGGAAQYSGFCQIVAGGDTQVAGVQGVPNPIVGGVGSASNLTVSVIHTFAAAGTADLKCWSPPSAPTTWSNPQIVAITLANT